MKSNNMSLMSFLKSNQRTQQGNNISCLKQVILQKSPCMQSLFKNPNRKQPTNKNNV